LLEPSRERLERYRLASSAMIKSDELNPKAQLSKQLGVEIASQLLRHNERVKITDLFITVKEDDVFWARLMQVEFRDLWRSIGES
jgi:hypothetical protein